ncbi:MAG: U32 family peptidase C-terminal domain-containing protein, partial [Clostridia bacterium]|nr:U32 family peptidase C-terminal domain-containing protein [Clostridia bacterium]
EGIKYAHQNNCRAYITLNTLPRNDEIAKIDDFIKESSGLNPDAFIITDLSAIDKVKRLAPNQEIHISVQTGIVNYETANFYYNLGAKRIVVARELSLEEIAEIRAKTPKDLEIEAFVHGAICMSVSGRCLLSNYMTGRDSNRGECAQPCRWNYNLVEEKRPGEYMPVYEDSEGTYILNAKDMCLIDHIPELYNAGITSFKIEGRAKTEYYTASVTNAYRRAVDGFINSGFDNNYKVNDIDKQEVFKISHRDYSTGFYFGRPDSSNGQVYDNAGYIRDYELIAYVLDYKDGIATVAQRNKFYPGTYDVLDQKKGSFEITVDKLYDNDMNELESAKYAADIVKFYCEPLKPGSFIRIKK